MVTTVSCYEKQVTLLAGTLSSYSLEQFGVAIQVLTLSVEQLENINSVRQLAREKTVEGTIAGLVVGTLTSIGLATIFFSQETLSLANAAFIGFLLSSLGQLGDLSVSLMKRTAGVKDSGDFIPGHGGFLDRCDSLIFTAPILYYYLALIGFFK